MERSVIPCYVSHIRRSPFLGSSLGFATQSLGIVLLSQILLKRSTDTDVTVCNVSLKHLSINGIKFYHSSWVRWLLLPHMLKGAGVNVEDVLW